MGGGLPEGLRPRGPRPQVQGDLEGGPGRDLEVHHQGADREVAGALRRLAGLAAVLAAAALVPLLASCGSSPTHAGRPADDNPFAGRVPREGSIILRDPRPAGRLPNGARPQPINIVLTTESTKGHAPDAPVGVNAGTIPEDAPKDRPSLGAAKKILAAEKKSTTTVISSEKFQQLWKTLDEADVFSLPRFRGGIPPDDRPSITLTGDGRSFTFLRPGDPLGGAVPTTEAEKTRMSNAWTNVKSIIGSSLGRL